MPNAEQRALFLTDQDGVRHFAYYDEMIFYNDAGVSDAWAVEMNALIDRKIVELSADEMRSARAKWAWFKKTFNAAKPPDEKHYCLASVPKTPARSS